jgi:hypothetical protein
VSDDNGRLPQLRTLQLLMENIQAPKLHFTDCLMARPETCLRLTIWGGGDLSSMTLHNAGERNNRNAWVVLSVDNSKCKPTNTKSKRHIKHLAALRCLGIGLTSNLYAIRQQQWRYLFVPHSSDSRHDPGRSQ